VRTAGGWGGVSTVLVVYEVTLQKRERKALTGKENNVPFEKAPLPSPLNGEQQQQTLM